MKVNIQKIVENMKYLAAAAVISLVLFLFLPVTYYLFHEQVYLILHDKKQKTVKIETVHIKEKEREIKEIEKRKKTEIKEFQKRFSDRFSLDLSVLSAGDGSAGVMEANYARIIEEGEADVPPIKKIYSPPQYPVRAREEGIEGRVVAKLLIDENGNVVTVKILEEPKRGDFGSAVIDAARRWRFEPAKLNNMPVKVWAIQVVNFTL